MQDVVGRVDGEFALRAGEGGDLARGSASKLQLFAHSGDSEVHVVDDRTRHEPEVVNNRRRGRDRAEVERESAEDLLGDRIGDQHAEIDRDRRGAGGGPEIVGERRRDVDLAEIERDPGIELRGDRVVRRRSPAIV